jgi:hypothetical protein
MGLLESINKMKNPVCFIKGHEGFQILMVWPGYGKEDYPFACKKCLDENLHQEHESELLRVDAFLVQVHKFI